MKKVILTFLFFFSFCIYANANEILVEHNQEIQNIENYLNGIKYFSADFVQDDNISNALSQGRFYLSRPKKLRLEYTEPNEILLITNDKSTVYYDVELEEVSKMPTKKTPIHFLTRDNFNFQNNDDIEVINFEKNENQTILSLMEKNKKDQGSISLIFQTEPLQLKSIEVNNELNQIITVNFKNINTNSKIENRLFVFKNPKSSKEIRSRY